MTPLSKLTDANLECLVWVSWLPGAYRRAPWKISVQTLKIQFLLRSAAAYNWSLLVFFTQHHLLSRAKKAKSTSYELRNFNIGPQYFLQTFLPCSQRPKKGSNGLCLPDWLTCPFAGLMIDVQVPSPPHPHLGETVTRKAKRREQVAMMEPCQITMISWTKTPRPSAWPTSTPRDSMKSTGIWSMLKEDHDTL